MKRFLSILLLLALLPLCFAACQRTPDEVIVVQKDTERLVEQARAHDGAADAGQALSARLGTPERYRADYAYADAFSMTADAAVVLPEADRLPTARVIPADFSQEREYSICLVRNISELTQNVTSLAVKCIITSATIILIATLLMRLIVVRSLKPVQKLKQGASQLAQGNYENRIELTGRDELAELASDFNSMADAIETNIAALHDSSMQLREKSQRQQTFINDLSHEMKTPVTSILLNAEMLLGRKVTPDVLQNALERIYDQGKWLERLSQKLMTLIMLQGKIELREESVEELLAAVKASTEDLLQENNITLLIKCSMGTLLMDFDLMRSALVNLVENARRASDLGGTILICAYDNSIEVIDHGKGIPKEEIPRITEPFYMVDRSRSKRSGGSGLGMALVKKIAQAHGAKLVIESAENRGTTIRLIFAELKS